MAETRSRFQGQSLWSCKFCALHLHESLWAGSTPWFRSGKGWVNLAILLQCYSFSHFVIGASGAPPTLSPGSAGWEACMITKDCNRVRGILTLYQPRARIRKTYFDCPSTYSHRGISPIFITIAAGGRTPANEQAFLHKRSFVNTGPVFFFFFVLCALNVNGTGFCDISRETRYYMGIEKRNVFMHNTVALVCSCFRTLRLPNSGRPRNYALLSTTILNFL